MPFRGFDKDLAGCLKALEKSNDKKWFDANRDRFRASVQDPFLEFLEVLGPQMEKTSPHIAVDAARK